MSIFPSRWKKPISFSWSGWPVLTNEKRPKITQDFADSVDSQGSNSSRWLTRTQHIFQIIIIIIIIIIVIIIIIIIIIIIDYALNCYLDWSECL